MNLPGAINVTHGEDLTFDPFRLPVHSSGSVQLEDLDFGTSLIMAWASSGMGVSTVGFVSCCKSMVYGMSCADPSSKWEGSARLRANPLRKTKGLARAGL